MRAMMLLAVLAAGCGKSEPPAPVLPTATTDARTDGDSIYDYFWRKAPNFETHPQEGKRIVVAVDGWAATSGTDAEGAACLMLHATDAVKRPKVVFRFGSAAELKPIMDGTAKYIEGTLRGAVAFDSLKFAAKWVNRAPHQPRMPDHFVLLEDCKAVRP